MNPTSRIVASGLLVTSLLTAQGPELPQPADAAFAGQRLPALRTPIHTAPPDLGIEYGIWAAGETYKASFHGGMTFVPYLGAGYPVTQTLHWRTASARLGTHELLTQKPPVPVQGEWRYEYRFGPITEAYDVRVEGLEQTFVLHQRPAAGDLVIRGVVTSRLRAPNVASAHQALVFADEQGQAIVSYGSAVAFDARGDRVLVDTACTDGTITLTLSGAWLEHAALPVTVDPTMVRIPLWYWVGPSHGLSEDIDIAIRPGTPINNVLLTNTRQASATDVDVWASVFNNDFSYTSNHVIFADLAVQWSTDQASCAYVNGRWVQVFRRHFVNDPVVRSVLRCHVHSVGNLALQSNVGFLDPPADRNDWRPDVGGVLSSGSSALVVFQREDNTANGGAFANTDTSDVRGCLLDVMTVDGTFGSTFAIKANAAMDNERPSVNQVAEGGASFSWVCVFQRILDGVANEDWDLVGARIADNGNVASGTWTSDLADASPSLHQLGPVVEGTDGRYAVAFATVDIAAVARPTSINGRKVQLERFNWADGNASPGGDQANVVMDSASDRRFEASGLGHDLLDSSHWVVGIREVAPGTPGLSYARVGFRGEKTEGVNNLYSIAGNQPSRASCAFTTYGDGFLFAYSADNGTDHPVFGHEVTYNLAQAEVNFGTSCSTAGLNWVGNQQIGAQFNRIELSGAPSSAIHLMLLSFASENLPVIHPSVAAGCRLFVDLGANYVGSFPIAIGAAASWELPLPEFLTAQDLFFQDWYLDATGLLFSTERIKVPIVK